MTKNTTYLNANHSTSKRNSFLLTALSVAMLGLTGGLAGCSDDDSGTSLSDAINGDTPAQTYKPISLSIAHINDHHSHLYA